MTLRGYSDRLNHAFAFAAKYRPTNLTNWSGYSGLVRASNVAVILSSYGADETTMVASVLKHLLDESSHADQDQVRRDVSRKFGVVVYQVVDEAVEPSCDFRGRERAWKACKLDHLSRLAMAHPRTVDVCVADAIHVCGCLLSDIRRLGREYVTQIAAASPEDTYWWYCALLDALGSHTRWDRTVMRDELRAQVHAFRIEVGLI